jgi:hypothetical protein
VHVEVEEADDHLGPRVAAVAAWKTPSISTPAHTVRSAGSTSTRVTNGVPIEHSVATPTSSQLPGGSAIARAVDGRGPRAGEDRLGIAGSTAKDQTVGRWPAVPARAQVAPPSRLRKTPVSPAARTPRGSPGTTASAWIRLFSGKGLR